MRDDESGAVTAETAAVIPTLVLLTLLLTWLVGFGVTQARVDDAARETARSVARGDDRTTSSDRGHRVAPEGATIEVERDERTVVVKIRADVRGLGGIFGLLPGRSVEGEAVAAVEPGS